jgi:hypothetical protein
LSHQTFMRGYIAELNRHAAVAEAVAAEQRAREDAKAAAADGARASLDGKLKHLLSTIPVEVQDAGLSIISLQVMLRPPGRTRACCTTGQLGDALRRHGFVRERAWHDGRSGFRALWRKRQSSTSAQTGIAVQAQAQASRPQASAGPNPLARYRPPLNSNMLRSRV